MKKRKNHIIWLSVLVLGLSTYHLIDHVSKQTTYEEVISETIEEESIQSISITSYETGERITVTDPKMINTFINGASDSKLTKSKNSDGNPLKYLVYFHTDTEHSYDIYTSLRLNDSMIQYDGDFYAVNDDHFVYQLTEDIFLKNSQQENEQ
ncbi:hypothetical protein SAMN05421839_12724 [Halolactibacillus halophilus]|uniref:Uncharacterized protein n=1 Tax=Halolactibacillus halophilus TaxID=306540 RepID=A0A1I5R8E1_9BACI|nr:hypothetical protein [Halolactibacillus halophilus]GEM02141.1 hypothetical protein HHA03_16730 [Halolactibacillus halophilus]SFP54266.1 hypothetical protein SAMN05421839_12724 [Halolactibacillus halophilus]